MVEVVAFTRALTDAGEHRVAAVLGRDIPNELLDDDGLTHARATEEADLTAFDNRADEVNNLDTRLEHLSRCRLVFKVWGWTVNGVHLLRLHRGAAVHRQANHVEYAAERFGADGHTDGRAGVGHGNPRSRPSVLSMATVRTTFAPECCCTSRTSGVLPFRSMVSAV